MIEHVIEVLLNNTTNEGGCLMKKFNINEPDKCDNCHNKISGEFFDTEYNGVKEPIKVCPACFKKGKCNNTIHYKNIDGFWYKMG
jgi:hypothetical protein